MIKTETERIISDGIGHKIEIKTDGQLYGFMAGDIITCQSPESECYGKGAVVEGFVRLPLEMWVTVIGEEKSLQVHLPASLILLERPGWKFKVGDKVKTVLNERLELTAGLKGEVIVLSPNNRDRIIVEFEGWKDGHSTKFHWRELWFPSGHKTESKSRWWCLPNYLDLAGGLTS